MIIQDRIVGLCPLPAHGAADVTDLDTAKFGPPRAGNRLFMQAAVMVDGFESLPRTFTALVPQAA